MFRQGRRLFTAASLGLIVVALMHSLGHFSPEPDDLGFKAVRGAMRSYHLGLGLGMQPSLHDVFSSLSLTMSVTLLLLGVLNLLVARSDEGGRMVRAAAAASVIGVGVLVGIFLYYRIPPPLIALGIVEALFVLSLALPDRSTAASGGKA